jgi:hypothetical protein
MPMRARLVVAATTLATSTGCNLVAGLQDYQSYPDAGTPLESGMPADATMTMDTGVDEAATDASPMDADAQSPAEAEAGATVTYSGLSDPSKWEFYDTVDLATTTGFTGGTAVGRYVYFGSASTTDLLRYDTTGPFNTNASWVLTTNSNVPVSNGGILSLGQYVYDPPIYEGYIVGRYDTSQPLDGGVAAFTSYEPPAAGYVDYLGGCTDGKRIYFVPYQYYDPAIPCSAPSATGTLLTYDTTAAGFSTTSSWNQVNLAGFNADAVELSHCVFDGQYVYVGNLLGGFTARYDTTQPIGMMNSWVFFQTNQTGLPPNLYGFNGMIYTGRYVVYVPYSNGSAYTGLAAAYDTTGGKFGEITSWSTYSLAQTDGGAGATGYAGGQFDGRYVYMAPFTSGLIVRWDSTRAFNDSSAWEVYDITQIHLGATHFHGTAFDGQYVYFSTYGGSAMARFKARDIPGNITPQSSFF